MDQTPEGTAFPCPIRLWPRSGGESAGKRPGDPFVLLSSGAQSFRAYLASLEVDGRVLVPHLTILMEPNQYPGAGTSGAHQPIGNRQVEEVWRRGLLRHRTLKTKSIACIDERALTSGGPEGRVPRHSPLAWCRKTGAYATPLCPACLGVMRTCRDEGLLRRCGLPSYEGSLIRFLHCPACAGKGNRPPVFYTYSLLKLDRLAQGVQLRHRTELYRDLGPRIVGMDTPQDPPGVIPAGGRADPAQDRHPCFRCEHRRTCYPAGLHVDDRLPAEELLYPLAYYDFYWMPMEPLPLSFLETAALMGGARPTELAGMKAEAAADVPLRREVLAELGQPGKQFFFEEDATGLFALEALYLKLFAVADLARGARDLLASTGFAHLSLCPDRLRGSLWIGPAILPTRWGLALKIGDLLTTAPPLELEPDRVRGEPEVGSLPHPCPEAFLPEGMCRPQIENLWMRLNVEELRVERIGTERVASLQARLTAPDVYRSAEHGNHDLVRVVLPLEPTEGQRVIFSGRKTGTFSGGFPFSGSTGPLSTAVATTLETTDWPASISVEVTLAHAFAAPADIVSLGLLMLRLLLGNDQQDATQLDVRLAGTLAETVAEIPRESAPEYRERLLQAFRNRGLSAAAQEVLHREVDRAAAEAALPTGLWEDALTLGVRMASNLENWSICATQDDYPASDPVEPLRMVTRELEALVERARGSLIGSTGHNTWVLEVCDDFLADLREAGIPDAGAGDGDAFERTMVSPAGGPSD